MSRPPVTYPVSLADLMLFADAAAELDAYKDTLTDKPAERARIIAMIFLVHSAVERAAGLDEALVYGVDEVAA